MDGVEEDVLDFGRGEFGEVRPQERRHARNNRRRHARPAVVDVVVVGAEAEDVLAGGEQVDTTLADVREFCDEQVVVGGGARPYVDEDGIHIAVPARVGVEGKRVDVVGLVAGGVHDEHIVGGGVTEGLTDASGSELTYLPKLMLMIDAPDRRRNEWRWRRLCRVHRHRAPCARG